VLKEPRRPRGSTPVSEKTHALGSKRVGDFEPLPEHQNRGPMRPTTLVDQLLNPSAPVEGGTWSEEGGYVKDETPEERARKALLAAEIRRQQSGR
jgi:hypothetical protein